MNKKSSQIVYVETKEQHRLNEARRTGVPWKKWGPHLSERQWATVREDYSQDGNAWDYFSHEQRGSRAYRWGEDGIAGISDDKQQLCFAIALWNGRLHPLLRVFPWRQRSRIGSQSPDRMDRDHRSHSGYVRSWERGGFVPSFGSVILPLG